MVLPLSPSLFPSLSLAHSVPVHRGKHNICLVRRVKSIIIAAAMYLPLIKPEAYRQCGLAFDNTGCAG